MALITPFTNQIRLPHDIFNTVLELLEAEDLEAVEKVCKSWKDFVGKTEQWKKQCRHRLNIPKDFDPSPFLRQGVSYKRGCKSIRSPKVFDEKAYWCYLNVEIGAVPPIPPEMALTRACEPDPCDPTKTIGQNYSWFYNPEAFKSYGDAKWSFAFELVPNTAINSEILFNAIGRRVSSGYLREYSTHISEPMKPGWICMRDEAIGWGLSFWEQLDLAKDLGVWPVSWQRRLNFNFFKQAVSGKYPDTGFPDNYAWALTCLCDQSDPDDYARLCGVGSDFGIMHSVNLAVGLLENSEIPTTQSKIDFINTLNTPLG